MTGAIADARFTLDRARADGVAVSLKAVTKDFGRSRAVDSIDLEIREGEFFALLGPSGCGKTTTLKMVGGFERPTAGEIFVHGVSVVDLPPFKRNVNTVFQNYALFPHLNVRDNVAFSLRMKGVKRRVRSSSADAALARVGLARYGERRVHELSGGEQQRVAVARALINEPAVLLLDEPLGALDLQLRKSMQAELKSIQHSVGITFVYVTHDQEEALTMADRIAVMHKGRLLQVGTPTEIYERPTTRFVASFIGESSFLDATVSTVDTAGIHRVILADGGVLLQGRTSAESHFDPGQSVSLVVRPEKVQLRSSHEEVAVEADANQLSGVVTDTVYVGSDVRFVISTAAGRVVARVPNVSRGAMNSPAVGDAVHLSFPVDGTVVVDSTDAHGRPIPEPDGR